MSESAKNVNSQLSALTKLRNSIRTRYAIVTGLFLLMVLAVFYVGGRIVLVHLVKDAEEQVREIGVDINRIAMRNADHIRRHVESIPAEVRNGSLRSLVGRRTDIDISLAMQLSEQGKFVGGVIVCDDGTHELEGIDLTGYSVHFEAWADSLRRHLDGVKSAGFISAGIVHVCGKSHYCAITERSDKTFLVLGKPFSTSMFTDKVNEAFAGMEMRVTNRKGPVAAVPIVEKQKAEQEAGRIGRKPYGIVPLVSEALNFYSGGFWHIGQNSFEAVYTIRDIAGRPVSMIAVSLPKTFSNAAGTAIGRLAFFVTMVGIVLVFPIFWFQGHMLLNPLTVMMNKVDHVRKHCDDTDCPRIDWKGSDEFAELAFSVNSLLEAITNRTMAFSESESRKKALINGIPDGLLVFDRNHNLVRLVKQPEAMRPLEGVTEGSPLDLRVYGSDGVAAVSRAIDSAIRNKKVESVTLQCGEGLQSHWFDVRISRTNDFFAVAVVRDVTEIINDRRIRRAAEKRLQHVQKQESLSLLASSVAHDVNNILSSILNCVEIATYKNNDPVLLDTLKTVRQAVRRGSVMSKELMTFAGETKYSLKRCDPAELMHDSHRVADAVANKNVVVRYNIEKGLPAVDADPDQIWKVFLNLIKNASEAMDGVGEVRVSASKFEMTEKASNFFFSSKPIPPGLGTLIVIEDDGPGIPKDMIRRVFDPYVSTRGTGRGFGLSTVYTIVCMHNGGICVKSKPGEGTSFSIFLPESKQPPEPEEKYPVAKVEGAIAKKGECEVLLVDDDNAILKTTSILLQAIKCKVHSASGYSDAMEQFHMNASKLACVILDAHLGQTDAVRLLASMRASSPDVPIVVSSGSSLETINNIFSGNRYDAFLPKPYTLEELKKMVYGFAKGI